MCAAFRRELGKAAPPARSAPSPAHGRSGERTTNEPSPAPEFAAARRDLEEATHIAVRSGFRLHEADARLEWARLHLAEGDREKARESLARAATLVEETGYHRRDAALAALEAALRDVR